MAKAAPPVETANSRLVNQRILLPFIQEAAIILERKRYSARQQRACAFVSS